MLLSDATPLPPPPILPAVRRNWQGNCSAPSVKGIFRQSAQQLYKSHSPALVLWEKSKWGILAEVLGSDRINKVDSHYYSLWHLCALNGPAWRWYPALRGTCALQILQANVAMLTSISASSWLAFKEQTEDRPALSCQGTNSKAKISKSLCT